MDYNRPGEAASYGGSGGQQYYGQQQFSNQTSQSGNQYFGQPQTSYGQPQPTYGEQQQPQQQFQPGFGQQQALGMGNQPVYGSGQQSYSHEAFGQTPQVPVQSQYDYGHAPSYGDEQSPHLQQATSVAQQHSGMNTEEDRGLFSNVLSSVMGSGHSGSGSGLGHADVQQMNNAHQQIYGQQNGQPNPNQSPEMLGSAAAMQALKLFSNQGQSGGQSQLLGLAMGEALKLFNAQGGTSADKGNILKTAATMAAQLYFTQKVGGSGAASNSSGLQSILQSMMGGAGSGQPQSQQTQQQQTHHSQSTAEKIAGKIIGKLF
ncbi:uncharacterized protein VTP21DRAFT_5221 [Calcarisporiella thermophila]|uniref:uncharacterized protein n=1 Tax=Calcarisporiella thermophila TaxID=911321 RepID=UPI003742648E